MWKNVCAGVNMSMYKVMHVHIGKFNKLFTSRSVVNGSLRLTVL